MSFRQFLKNIYYTKVKKWDAEQIRIDHLRRSGVTIGKNTHIFSDYLETPEPYLISIGDNVMIAPGVRFITHDVSTNAYTQDKIAYYGRVTIGNNCFIGMAAIVMPGVTLANNCIVAAGSVVTKSFRDPGSVIAGNPAREICTVEEVKLRNERYALDVWGMTFQEKKEYLLSHEDKFKGYPHK